jgi:hypothetical protein
VFEVSEWCFPFRRGLFGTRVSSVSVTALEAYYFALGGLGRCMVWSLGLFFVVFKR